MPGESLLIALFVCSLDLLVHSHNHRVLYILSLLHWSRSGIGNTAYRIESWRAKAFCTWTLSLCPDSTAAASPRTYIYTK